MDRRRSRSFLAAVFAFAALTVVPVADAAPLSAKLLKRSTLKVFPKFPHGMCTTNAEVINAELLKFFKG